MNTKLLMTASAAFLLVLGVALEFLPREVLGYLGAPADGFVPVMLQLAGALLIGFAVMNWMAKAVLIGGIYARPLAIGNFAHFLIGALALLKYCLSNTAPPSIWVVAILYSIFALAFGYVFVTHPATKASGRA